VSNNFVSLRSVTLLSQKGHRLGVEFLHVDELLVGRLIDAYRLAHLLIAGDAVFISIITERRPCMLTDEAPALVTHYELAQTIERSLAGCALEGGGAIGLCNAVRANVHKVLGHLDDVPELIRHLFLDHAFKDFFLVVDEASSACYQRWPERLLA